ncbi:MAG TPA: ABC transporter permease, partial [Bryobacteraceae bacterium]|nr:ABC transporter permease [Bryobacteraceae bacterium]
MLRDLLLAGRRLAKNPWFLAAVIAILGLAIGANTAVFSVADAVLLRPSPYRDAGRLVTIEQTTPKWVMSIITANDYLSWADRKDIFEQTVPHRHDIVTMTNAGDPDQVFVVRTSAQLFPLLGVRAKLGRALLDSDDAPNGPNSAVISDRLWRRKFDADPAVIGRTVQLSDEAFTIVGVMAPEFEFPYPQEEMWVPLRLHPGGAGALQVIARLRAGVTPEQAQNAMQAEARELERRDPQAKAGLRIVVSRWKEELGD